MLALWYARRHARRRAWVAALCAHELSTAAEAAFHAAAEETLGRVQDAVEEWGDGAAGSAAAPALDVAYESGVLTVALGGNLGTYVLNKQAPNRQLWLSSPVSGPARFDLSEGTPPRWVYARTGKLLESLLEEEVSELIGVPLEIPPPEE